MTSSSRPDAASPPTALAVPGWHEGPQACTDALRQTLLALAPRRDADRPSLSVVSLVRLIDPDFSDWPLDEAPVLAALTAWLRQGGRRLQWFGLDFERSARALPHLTRWRRDWQHVTEAFQPAAGQPATALRGLLAPPFWLQRGASPQWRLRVDSNVQLCRAAEVEIADYLQHCEPAWPSTTLGL